MTWMTPRRLMIRQLPHLRLTEADTFMLFPFRARDNPRSRRIKGCQFEKHAIPRNQPDDPHSGGFTQMRKHLATVIQPDAKQVVRNGLHDRTHDLMICLALVGHVIIAYLCGLVAAIGSLT